MTTLHRFLCTLLLFITSLSASDLSAQNYRKEIISRPFDGGMLYFIRPQHISPDEGNTLQAKPLSFDITYAHPSDSITFNSTITLSSPYKFNHLCLQLEQDKVHKFPLSIFFAEPKGKSWVIRLSTRMPYKLWRDASSQQHPIRLVYQVDEQEIIGYRFTEKEWKKQQGIISLLDQIISF